MKQLNSNMEHYIIEKKSVKYFFKKLQLFLIFYQFFHMAFEGILGGNE